MKHLAKLIVSDGEGATKFVEYKVEKAPNEAMARKIVRSISNSCLVKTALFGRDPNWGRIICAAGNAGVNFDFDKVDLYIANDNKTAHILSKGTALQQDNLFLKKILRDSALTVKLTLNAGKAEAVGWGTDLSTDYVLFNSVYTT